MSFLSFLSQKTHPEEFLRPEIILNRNYLRKCSIWPLPSIIINLPFVKNAINSEPLGVRGYYFQELHVSVIPITSKSDMPWMI